MTTESNLKNRQDQITPGALWTFISSSGLTNLADGVATIAWAWLASLLTRDPLYIALVPVALRLPWFIFALPAGIITDRVDRRQLILSMDAIRALVFTILAISIWQALPLDPPSQEGIAEPWLFTGLLISALLVGGAEVFRDNAAQTMMPSIVPVEALEKANGRLWSVELVGNALLGPALGAFLIAAFLPLPFAVNAIAYLIAMILIFRIAGRFKPSGTKARNWKNELRDGIDFLKASPLLKSLALITGFWNLLFHMAAIALVLHVQDNFQAGARTYGLVLAAGAVGGILGGIYGEKIIARLGPGRSAQIMLAASVPSFFAIALAPGPISLAIVLAAFEFTGIVWNTVSVSYRQRTIPDHLLGRVNSLYRLLAWGMMPIGLVLSGLIVRISEPYFEHATALIMPFLAATVASLVLAMAGWRALERGFSIK